MLTFAAPLSHSAASLRSGKLDLHRYIDEILVRMDALEPQIQAFLPEPDRKARLFREAGVLYRRFPDPSQRPPLYGILVGVKDIFRVDGFPTRAGSQLPAGLFVGPEAACVSALRALGVLILGKTVTTEFAYREPGPTRNPHNLAHTPGGSSSGSAAAVAAGFCQLALGTQTIGSVIRPAAYCGIVGYKPSYGRVSTEGVIYFSESADQVGFFTQDVAGMRLVASLVCRDWRTQEDPRLADLPVLGIPEGAYLSQASKDALVAFERQLKFLEQRGYPVRRVKALEDIAGIAQRHRKMIAAEMAHVHARWFSQYESHYRPSTAAMIREGRRVSTEELEEARSGRQKLRFESESLMAENRVDLWVSPAAPGPAPEGIASTGDPAMNLPWTHAGLPVITVPADRAANGLPLGLQIVAPFMADERLLQWAESVAKILETHNLQDRNT